MMASDSTLPPGWSVRLHQGLPLFVHAASGTSTWTRPPPSSSGAGGKAHAAVRFTPSTYEQPLRDIARFLSDMDRTGAGVGEGAKQNPLAVTLQSEYDRIRALVARPHLTAPDVSDVTSAVEYMQQQIKQYEIAQSTRSQPMGRPVEMPISESEPNARRRSHLSDLLKPAPELDPSVSVVSTYIHARSPAEKARALDRLVEMEREWKEFKVLEHEST